MGILKVRVIEAKNLVAKDLGGTSDPYVVLRVGKEQRKTRVVKKNLSPYWNESFQFQILNPYSETLIVQVFDYDLIGSNDPLGHVHVPLANLIRGREQDLWMRLSGTRQGEIHLALLAEDFGKDPQPNQPMYGAQQPMMQQPMMQQPMMQQPMMQQPMMQQPMMQQPMMQQPMMQQPMMQQPMMQQPGVAGVQVGMPQQQMPGYQQMGMQQQYPNQQYPRYC